MYNIQHNH